MSERAKKLCANPKCGNVVVPGGTSYCESCAKNSMDYSVHDRRSKKTDLFYLTPRWRKFSKWYRIHHPLCAVCGHTGRLVDHVVPVRYGGDPFDEDNVQTLCQRCHNRKTGGERRGDMTASRPRRGG